MNAGPDDLHYLRTVLRRLRELQKFVEDIEPEVKLPRLGTEALADEIDWLDCYIDRIERQTK